MAKIDTIPRSRLLERTIELLRNRPKTLTLPKIEADTDLPEAWLTSLVMNSNIDPAVNRIVVLYEYLSGKKLEI